VAAYYLVASFEYATLLSSSVFFFLGFSALIFISSILSLSFLRKLQLEIKSLEDTKNYLLNENKKNIEFKTILDNINIAICVRDKDLNILYFNYPYAKIILADDKLIDNNSIELDKRTRQSAKLTVSSKTKRISERFIVVGGKRYLYQLVDSFLPNLNQVCSTAYDVTSKAVVEKELKLNINAQKKLLESTGNAISIYDSDRRLKYYNQAYVKLWELDESYLDTSPKYEDIVDKLFLQRRISEYTNFQKFKKDRVKLFTTLTDTYNDFLFLPDGRSLRLLIIPYTAGGLLFSFEDMTDHFALKVSYNTLIKVQQTTLNNLQESICVFSADGTINLYNSNFKKLWDLEDEFFNSDPTIHKLTAKYKLLFKKDIDFRIHLINISKASGDRQIVKEYIKRTDNIYIKRRMIPLPNGATMISDLNVTDSALIEQSLLERTRALEDSDYVKSEFLNNVSYEFRSPLTSIMGYAELLKRMSVQELSPKARDDYIDNIIDSSRKLGILIDDILDLATALAGNTQLNLSKFDALPVVQNTIDSLDKLSKNNQVECMINYDLSDQHIITADPRIFEQIIAKLLCNAIEYSPVNSKVVIEIKNEKDDLQISVSNKGDAIPIEEQDFIFNKFYQGRNQKTNAKSGIGMGLSFIKEMIELHQGTIKFNSNQEIGTIFICKFPKTQNNTNF
jgi:signal transduction histidine kinase